MVGMSFDRTISAELLQFLRGPGKVLLEWRSRDPTIFDVQLRRAPKGNVSWASLYCGLTSILDLEERDRSFRLSAHKTHRDRGGFDTAWGAWAPAEELADQIPHVARYLDRVAPLVDKRWTDKEGAVHAGIASGQSDAYRIINRETSPSFKDQATRDRLTTAMWRPLRSELVRHTLNEKWWPDPHEVKIGTSPDFLGVDIGGRLLVIEAKHHSATSMLTKVALQVGFYARMFGRLIDEEPQALDAMQSMLAQRVDLELSRSGHLYLTEPTRVVPVVAVGPGRPSKEAHRRLWLVADAVSRAGGPGNVDPVEVWYLDGAGRIVQLERPADVVRS